jgi:hypothetical protein
MKPLTLRAPRALAVAAVAAGIAATLVFGASSAADLHASPPSPDPMAQHEMQQHAQHHTQHLQEQLDHLAARLEIKASQQDAWQAFAAAFRDVMAPASHVPALEQADAAGLARAHADRAAEHAQKLARMADATAKLQQSLAPEQRQVLNEVARRFVRERLGQMGDLHGGMHGDGAHGAPHCEGPDEGHMHGYGMPGDMHGDHHGNPHEGMQDGDVKPEMPR